MSQSQSGKVVKFDVKAGRFRWVDRAARYALAEIAPDGVVDLKKVGIVETYTQLIRAWRTRIRRLSGAGWEAPNNPKNWSFIYNCPPTGVITNRTKLRTCQHVAICPFCWCRRHVHPAFQNLEYFYYGARPAPGEPYELVEPRENHLLEIVWGSDYDASDHDPRKLLEGEIQPNRRFLLDRLGTKPIGAFQMFVIVPPDNRDKFPYWSVETRLLAIMPTEGFIPYEPAGNETLRHHTTVDRKALVAAVGRTCSYPKQLFCGSIVETAALANFFDVFDRDRGKKVKTAADGTQIKGFRMTSKYGALRCGQAVKQNKPPPGL